MSNPASFQDLLRDCQSHGRIPQLSAVWVHQGTEQFSGGLGENTHAETRYPIASITKTFTAHLVASTLQERSISLTTPMRELMPYFSIAHPRSNTLTVDDLLNHQTPMKVHQSAWVTSTQSRREFIEQTLPQLDCHDDPEPQYRYSNIMYAVLGQLIEDLTGQSWEYALAQNILTPLEMTHTPHIDENWQQTPQLAPPMKQGANGMEKMSPFFARKNHLIAPASELISTAHDLSIWAQHANQIHPWKTNTPVLLSTDRPTPELGPLYSANGWRMETYANETLYWHSGQCSGYTALLSCIPDRQFSLSLLCNLDGAVDSLQALMYSTIDVTPHSIG